MYKEKNIINLRYNIFLDVNYEIAKKRIKKENLEKFERDKRFIEKFIKEYKKFSKEILVN